MRAQYKISGYKLLVPRLQSSGLELIVKYNHTIHWRRDRMICVRRIHPRDCSADNLHPCQNQPHYALFMGLTGSTQSISPKLLFNQTSAAWVAVLDLLWSNIVPLRKLCGKP